MNPERWVRIEELFNRAVECEPDQRNRVLENAGDTDPDLRREVESLLFCHAAADAHLRAAVREEAGAIGLSLTGENGGTAFITGARLTSDAAPGAVIGPYHLIELIGQGGMGEVWLAEQKQPVRRQIAIKLIKAGMDTREVVARFESERQALALMDHPAIAKVFEAGSTPSGHPYFVMEYVFGMPITEYCDKHKLSLPERLQVFIQVCEGVRHAHQKSIIHRDLKPSNILVTKVNDTAVPRIIDFGVAKAISQPLTQNTFVTRVGALLGTPEYMSPEQADSTGEDIDTRTDVYSLGVILFELLAGTVPFDFQKLTLAEMLRKLRADDPCPPSTKVRTLGKQSEITAQNRRTEPKALVRQLHGDLDSIVMKALDKDRSRRYSTPSEFAADIGRCLRNEPVTARSPSVAYRARKYVRRHRIGVGVAAAALLLLASLAIAQAFEIRRITRERDRADRITNFMTRMFKVSSPSEARGNKVTAREILDKASKDIDTGLTNDPELQAEMMHTMATVYTGLGLYSRAEALLRRAIDINRRALGPKHPVPLRWSMELSQNLLSQGRYPEAQKVQRTTLYDQRQVLGPEHPDTLRSLYGLGKILEFEGNFLQAERLQRGALDLQRRVLGSEHPETLATEEALASIFRAEGRFADSEKAYRRMVEFDRRREGEDHPYTLFDLAMLSDVLRCEQRFVESENLGRQTLEVQRRILGPDHQNTLDSMAILAQTLQGEGRYQEAEKLQRESLERRRRSLGQGHPTTLRAVAILGSILNEEGRYTEAEKLEREALDTQRMMFGAENFDTATSTYYLAGTMALTGKKNLALVLLKQAVAHAMPEIYSSIEIDPDFKSLHGDPRFAALVNHANQELAAPQNTE